MGEINQSCKRAINVTINNLRKEAGKENPDKAVVYDLYLDLQVCCQFGFINDPEHKDYYKTYTEYIKTVALKQANEDKERIETWRSLYWDTLKLETRGFFESYLLYMEHKRPYDKRFYEPRKGTLSLVVKDLQDLEDSKSQKMYCLSLPARTGKSTLIVLFLTWIVLRHPMSHNAMGTHSGMLADHFYKEFLDIFATPEYCFEELYYYWNPKLKFIEDQSAEKMTISFAQKGDFPTITCRGIDGTWTGAVDISSDGYLCVDDLVRDRTHSLSPKRMNDTFSEYLNKMVDRMNDGAKQLMIGTLWNVMDPIKRLEEMYSNDTRYVFRKIPALNENNESNFDYEYKGFSTEYYLEMRDRLIRAGNEAEWMAKYQQEPYVREGLLFPSNELGFFNGVLPVDHKFSLVTVCDVAFGGGDSVSMPIGLQDESTDDVYIIDWYFNSMGVSVTVPGVVDMLIKYGIMEVTFEKNNGGQMFADKVQEELKKRQYICSCNTKPAPNNISKEDKIKGCEGEIKNKLRFLDSTKHDKSIMGDVTYYERSPQYERALSELTTFVTIGKNDHDDAADSIAQLVIKAFGTFGKSEVRVLDRYIYGF